jgi:hypothetical protein
MGVCMEGRCSGVAAFWWVNKMGIGIWIGLGCMTCFLAGCRKSEGLHLGYVVVNVSI